MESGDYPEAAKFFPDETETGANSPVTELEARVLEMVLPSLETPFEEAKERDAYRASRAAAWVLG